MILKFSESADLENQDDLERISNFKKSENVPVWMADRRITVKYLLYIEDYTVLLYI